MKLSNRKVGLITLLIVLSLGGLTLLQISLFKSAMQLKETTFRNNVMSVLDNVVDQIEVKQLYVSAFQTINDSTNEVNVTTSFPENIPGDSLRSHVIVIAIDSVNQTLGLDDTCLKFISSDVRLETESVDRCNFNWNGFQDSIGENYITYRNVKDTSKIFMNLKLAADSGRIDFISRVLDRMWVLDTFPVENRLDSAVLDSIIGKNLADNNINLDYIFGVKLDDLQTELFANNNKYQEELFTSEYKTRLFPYDVFGPQVMLYIYFPKADSFLWSDMTPLLLLTIIFLAIIIFCFAYTIRKIIDQKRNASFLVGFINNMTHEFKTPISTVALAAEAIMRYDQIHDADKVERYARMIKDENVRMRNQAEKILQMAALEEGDFDLKLKEIDLHVLIQQAVDNISLHVVNRQGKITTDLMAEKYNLIADPDHLNSIIYNLLDNANKYSPESPDITIATKNFGNGVIIKVTDRGIGIRESDIGMVFKKYFRVASGNIHDVKGFGLGLSYVKLLVEAHRGSIKISSRFGDGTTVELFLPINIKG